MRANRMVLAAAVCLAAFAQGSSATTLSESNGKGYTPTVTATPSPAPEPASLALLGTGLLGIGGIVRKKMRNA